MATYLECVESCYWPGYPTTITPISLPLWAMGPQDDGEGYDAEVKYSDE